MSISVIKVAICGLGPIGTRVATVAASKESLRVVGAMDIAPAKVGKRLSDLGDDLPSDIKVVGSLDDLLASCSPQVVLHATGSYLSHVYPQYHAIISAGLSIVSTCEEAVYPVSKEAQGLAEKLDDLCKRRGARLLGTGINPGFAMDVWPLVLTATHSKVQRIVVRRIVDASSRREPLQRKVGAGLSVEQFDEAATTKKIGHVGLAASAHMLAKGLARDIRSQRETILPILADREIQSQYYHIAPGEVAGLQQELVCELEGGVELTLHLEMYLGAPDAHDEVLIEGDGVSKITVPGGYPGDGATAALVCNAVKPLLSCPAGYHTMLDLPFFGCLR
ncbi:MAG: NAD(P)H-dependent amine dehydrogenase family protein [Anaerolineae bacterium]